ncbi:MAG: hypothetical protein ACT4PZ_01955 [Panacagrimonas sp.]
MPGSIHPPQTVVPGGTITTTIPLAAGREYDIDFAVAAAGAFAYVVTLASDTGVVRTEPRFIPPGKGADSWTLEAFT